MIEMCYIVNIISIKPFHALEHTHAIKTEAPEHAEHMSIWRLENIKNTLRCRSFVKNSTTHKINEKEAQQQ